LVTRDLATCGRHRERERERESEPEAGRLLLANSCCRPSLGEGDNKSRKVIDRETMFNA
jgi:hypothetical protein